MSEKSSEKKLTSNPFKAEKTIGRIKNVLRNAPVIGTVADVVDIGKELVTGDYAGAAVAAGTALAGVTPIGRIASKGAKVVSKKLKKLSKVDESKDSLKAINLTEKDLENWNKDPNNITSPEFKKKLEGRKEELQNIAKAYKDNPTDETLDLYRRKVIELNPIKKIETMPNKPSFLDIRGALGIKVDSMGGKKTGIIGLNRNIKDGQRIASRLDINGYTNHNKWVATLTIPRNLIRDWISKNPTLSPTSYAAAVRLKNVDLKQTEGLQKKSLNIAAGERKGPHAVMEGDYSADDPDDIYNYAKEIFESKDKDWIQVGYNPTRAGFFYDRGTGIPIESADEIVQVGPLVLAKNAVGGSIKDYMFNKGGIAMKSRKLVGKPTGRVTKAGRPVLKTPEGEERSEYSATIKLDNGKYINIPTIHNGKYYTEDELKKAVEDKRMIPTSEHDSFEEAIEAAKKRSKTLKQGGVLKAHQGTIVNGQIVYPTTSQAPADPEPIMPTEGLPNPFVTDPTTIPPKQVPPNKMEFDIPIGESVSTNPMNYPIYDPRNPNYNPAMEYYIPGKGLGGNTVDPTVTTVKQPDTSIVEPAPVQIPNPMATGLFDPTVIDQSRAMLAQQPAKKNMTIKEFFGGKAISLKDFLEQKNKQQLVSQFSKDFNLSQKSEQIQKPITDKLLEVRQKYLPKLNELEFKLQNNLIDSKEFETQYTPITQLMSKEMNDVKMQNMGLMQDVKLQQDNLQKQFEDAFFKQYKPVGQGSTISKPMPFNEGGTVMEKQMEMNFGEKSDMSSGTFLFNEGGMKDDGGEKDPVSGNDVPSGSLAKEVRDDVPAMVSEGEFIFPADVTRYIGLDKLMQLRQEAKMGLKKMEMMGQLGNPEESVLPDDIPFDPSDILIIDEEDNLELDNLNQGGIIGFQEGTANAGEQANQYYDITDEANKKYAKRYVYYKNDAGQTITILSTFDGTPLEPVPAGYKMMINKDGLPATELPKDEDIEEKKPEVEQPSVQQTDDDDGPEAQPFYSAEYLADKFKGDVIYDANGNPRSLTEQGYLSTQTSANRLGLDMNTYFNLPMSAKMDMLGQEFAGMFGKEVDQDYINNIVEQVKAGTYKGKGIAGYIGGIGDWISSWFGNDNPDDVQKKIKQTNNATGNTNVTKTESPFDPKPGKKRYERDDTYGVSGIMRTSDDPSRPGGGRGTTSAVRKAQSDRVQAGLAGPGMAAGKFKQREDNEARRQAKREKQGKESFGMRAGPTTGGSSVAKAQKQTQSSIKARQDAKGDDAAERAASRRGFASGTMVTKSKKKPTKGKTLVTKRS